MAGRPTFGPILLRQDGDAQAADENAAPPPAPPAPPFPPSGPSPLPARAVWFRGKVVGHVDPFGVFSRRVHAHHVIRHPPSIALHIDVLAQLARLGAVAVAFTLDDGSVLAGPLSLYTGARGFDVDRGGYGPQRAVLLTDFAKVEVRPATADDVAAFAGTVGW